MLDYLKLSYHYLQFLEDSSVRKGIFDDRNQFKELGKGKYKIEAGKITFYLKSGSDRYESIWKGIIGADTLEIEIEHSDFEDIEGVYQWVPNSNN